MAGNPEEDHSALIGLSATMVALKEALVGLNKEIERLRSRNEKDLQGIQERYDSALESVRERQAQHSLRCLFSPERNGMAEHLVKRVDELERLSTQLSTIPERLKVLELRSASQEGALALLRWIGFGTLAGVAGLAIKAALGS